ncbi:MAG: hypothetical protein ACM3XZ_09985 [Betaproteobacteria bacterium]
MRQGAGRRRVIYLNWDGFAWEYFEEALRRGRAYPGLQRLAREGTVFARAETAPSLQAGSQVIPRPGAARLARSQFGPHLPRSLGGRHHGSGTIFFGHCNLACLFCQNHDISCEGVGEEVRPAELAEIMLDLQSRGCHNLNLVSPSPVVPQILLKRSTWPPEAVCGSLWSTTPAGTMRCRPSGGWTEWGTSICRT